MRTKKLMLFSSSSYKLNTTEIEQICEKYGIEFYKSNIDENPMLAEKYGIRYYPTFLLLEDGKEVKRRSHMEVEKIERFLNE